MERKERARGLPSYKRDEIEPMGGGNVHQFFGRRRRKALIGGESRPHAERQTGMRKRKGWGEGE